ncbi:SMI1/KNR4 family protein [Streptantibioticus silvisoli]|uniref:SMI1/KNR4 family protein n=1 Tax=Streptantibioticus silvisoli TaxID=2705255 RepID=A0ABT6W3D5_9ACTN|nr:SMI1/KNR4 family protein [Streptantibioticus silvisoli]MDI5964915.1 SMI1/KNR4 family protein [Streptantibioticus silvisoli]
MMLSISDIAAGLRRANPESVAGLTDAEMKCVREQWGIRKFPARYEEFLSLMGRGAGRILLGTDAFFPEILEMRRASDEFFADNPEGMDLPDGAVVFAMHQGYQVYWMDSSTLQDPPVSLCMEGERAPMAHWASFTEFLNSEYLNVHPGF